MSGDPLLGIIREIDERFEVIETERSLVAPCAGLILNGREKVVEKKGPFSLMFSQIVALMFPHRSVFAGLLLVAIFFPPLLK